MNQPPKAPITRLYGAYHNGDNVPMDVFVVRKNTDKAAVGALIEEALSGTEPGTAQPPAAERAEDVTIKRINWLGRRKLKGALGATATTPAVLLYALQANDDIGARIHEL